jgi:exopolysaccharide biosynthesis protein
MLGEVHFEKQDTKLILDEQQINTLMGLMRKMKMRDTSFENTGHAITVELEKDFMIVDGSNISFTSYCLYDPNKIVCAYLNKLTLNKN